LGSPDEPDDVQDEWDDVHDEPELSTSPGAPPMRASSATPIVRNLRQSTHAQRAPTPNKRAPTPTKQARTRCIALRAKESGSGSSDSLPSAGNIDFVNMQTREQHVVGALTAEAAVYKKNQTHIGPERHCVIAPWTNEYNEDYPGTPRTWTPSSGLNVEDEGMRAQIFVKGQVTKQEKGNKNSQSAGTAALQVICIDILNNGNQRLVLKPFFLSF
jgi:hypothetical protein